MSDNRMPIPANKVNLAEKDIEDYLHSNPAALSLSNDAMFRWFGRQVTVPSGIIDLLGHTARGQLAVVEVKNVEIDAAALTQVCRYAFDVDAMIPYAVDVLRVVVGPHASDRIFREAEALGVEIVVFTVTLTASFSTLHWTDDFITRRNEQYETYSQSAPIAGAIEYYTPEDVQPDEATTEDEIAAIVAAADHTEQA